MSQQVPFSQKMDRAASNLSTKSAGPFTGSTPVSPLPTFQTPSLRTKHLDFNNSYMIDESVIPPEVFHSLMQHIPTEKPPQHFQQGVVSLTDMTSPPSSTGPLLDPDVWLASHTDPSLDMSFPFSSAHHTELDVSNINTAASVCGSMTSGPTYDNTAPMTRQNSHQLDNTVVGGVRMVNMGSQMSQGQDAYFSDFSQQNTEYSDVSPFMNKQSFREDALLAVGSSLAPSSGQPYPAAASNEGLLLSSDMERSLSNTSTTSAKSTSSSLSARAKDTLKQQNHRALNAPLKPKPSVDENKSKPASEEKPDGKAAITKAKYVRARQPKVHCELCDEHKDGFRGEHELRRHKDAKHQALVKKFMCVDPHELGLPVNVQVVNPLSKCKACKAKKKYGAYYNAAAHLRRTHFKEKPSRAKNKGSGANISEEEKRGGKGGGDWPSMPELKNWMREVYVRQDEQQSKEDEDAEDEVVNTPSFFADAESQANVDTTAASSFAPVGMASVDYSFTAPMAVNTDMSYINPMPLSSADFLFTANSSPNMQLGFNSWN